MNPEPLDGGPPSIRLSDNRVDRQIAVDIEALGDLFAAVLQRQGVSGLAEASLTLLDPDEIAQLKVRYLDGDGAATDVLSFPIDGADCPEATAGGPSSWMVGDVLICPSVAADQAPEHAGNLRDELALLVIHGTLHLLGWDHVEQKERQEMWRRESDLFSEFSGTPQRNPWLEADYYEDPPKVIGPRP